ncbi:LCP family protein [Agreia sp. COWG]|uniref:LCP family protein n=1 Tax=Agreia sp. COWG TaxID=2773266 RepID=UPI0019268278|nr:LCP family protein [Agreia sp. COWG]CAD5995642.1 Transcriptional attenuator, LytR family [Agreia sp. COWG]
MTTSIQPARHAHSPNRRPWSRVLSLVGIVAAVAVVSAGGIAAVGAWTLASKVEANAVDIHPELTEEQSAPGIGALEGGFNVLIVAADNDANQSQALYGERDGATLNDVNMLLHVSQDHKTAVAVSFPRDLVIAHPECEKGDAMRAAPINEAWGRGGLACVVATVTNLTGLDIQYAVSMTFDAVIALTDSIGGVPICLTGRVTDDNVVYPDENGVLQHLDLPAGVTEVQGGLAAGFLRSRHGVGDGGDLSRISSQQQYLSSLVRKLKSNDTLGDFGKLYSLANVVANPEYFTLSTSLSKVDTMISMAQAMRTIDLNNITFVQYPGTTGNPDFPGKVMPTRDAADALFELIKADQPFTLGEDSQPIGTTTEPTAPAAPEAPVDPAVPADPATPTEPSTPQVAGPPVLDGVTGSTAQQETCAIPNTD